MRGARGGHARASQPTIRLPARLLLLQDETLVTTKSGMAYTMVRIPCIHCTP